MVEKIQYCVTTSEYPKGDLDRLEHFRISEETRLGARVTRTSLLRDALREFLTRHGV